jgi:hypothetical protein
MNASAQRFGHTSSAPNSAKECQSASASSGESFAPIRRCSGVPTAKIPPKLSFAQTAEVLFGVPVQDHDRLGAIKQFERRANASDASTNDGYIAGVLRHGLSCYSDS